MLAPTIPMACAQALPMDKHYLTPLFSPASIVVFAGDAERPDTQTALARALLANLQQGGFAGTVTHLDIHMTGTLADLASRVPTWR